MIEAYLKTGSELFTSCCCHHRNDLIGHVKNRLHWPDCITCITCGSGALWIEAGATSDPLSGSKSGSRGSTAGQGTIANTQASRNKRLKMMYRDVSGGTFVGEGDLHLNPKIWTQTFDTKCMYLYIIIMANRTHLLVPACASALHDCYPFII